MTPAELASRIDHTLLKPEATLAQIKKVIGEARTHGFASVCVNPTYAREVARGLEGSKVLCCVVAGFPLGTNLTRDKIAETLSVIDLGAQEVDFVVNLGWVLDGRLDDVQREFAAIVAAAKTHSSGVVLKVILETAALMALGPDKGPRTIADVCHRAHAAGLDFVKTSTGFHPAGGADIASVQLLKQHSEGMRVKAAGGIRNLASALAMVEAGADRLGLSASLAIMQELAASR